MKLVMISHKPCWRSSASPSGFATDGGFPAHVRAISGLFDHTMLLVPVFDGTGRPGEQSLVGHNLEIRPLRPRGGGSLLRKASFPFWFAAHLPVLLREVRRADAVHAPIPGDVGTAGMFAAVLLRKPLFVRHCGNWAHPRTLVERLWRRAMIRLAGASNVMVATGASDQPPAPGKPIDWVFSTSLTEADLAACSIARHSPSWNAPRLIIVSRQEADKGTDIAIRALALIRKNRPGATLDVVGDGTALPQFRQLAVDSGLSDSIKFHGRVGRERVLSLLQESDLLVYPTTASEGFPKILVEALACGLPVVTSTVSALPAILRAGGGVTVRPLTPERVAAAVEQVLSDPVEYQRLSESAREVASAYSLERWQARLESILRRAWGPLRAPATQPAEALR